MNMAGRSFGGTSSLGRGGMTAVPCDGRGAYGVGTRAPITGAARMGGADAFGRAAASVATRALGRITGLWPGHACSDHERGPHGRGEQLRGSEA